MTDRQLTVQEVQTLEWWTVREVANQWRLSEDTILRMIADKLLLARRFGRQWRIHRTVIAAYEAAAKPRSTTRRPTADPLGIYGGVS